MQTPLPATRLPLITIPEMRCTTDTGSRRLQSEHKAVGVLEAVVVLGGHISQGEDKEGNMKSPKSWIGISRGKEGAREDKG